MGFRVATLNLAQDQKRWEERRELIVQQLGELQPDILCLNEIYLPFRTGYWLKETAERRLGLRYTLLEQPKTAAVPHVEAEGLLTRYPVIEQWHHLYDPPDSIALVARVEIEEGRLEVYVTHLYGSRREDSIRVAQVEQLLRWIKERNDVEHKIVCGDFNATTEMDSVRLMAGEFRATQSEPTAFTSLRETDGLPSHPQWRRLDRCIDFIWVTESVRVLESGLCFNQPSREDPMLWPSDHVGVWADLEFA